MAFLSSGIPPAGVYLVLPASIALMAAFLIWAGVSKSGSPDPKPITSTPFALRELARAVIASVADGFTLRILPENCISTPVYRNEEDVRLY